MHLGFPHNTFEVGLSLRIRRCIARRRSSPPRSWVMRSSFPMASLLAEVLATCLACLVHLGELPQTLSSRCGRSRASKACVVVSHALGFENARHSRGTGWDISTTCNVRLSLVPFDPTTTPTRSRIPLVKNLSPTRSDRSTCTSFQS